MVRIKEKEWLDPLSFLKWQKMKSKVLHQALIPLHLFILLIMFEHCPGLEGHMVIQTTLVSDGYAVGRLFTKVWARLSETNKQW